MSAMSELALRIEELYFEGYMTEQEIAADCKCPVDMVKQYIKQLEAEMMSELPEDPMPTDEEVEAMAQHYGYGKEVYNEFDC